LFNHYANYGSKIRDEASGWQLNDILCAFLRWCCEEISKRVAH